MMFNIFILICLISIIKCLICIIEPRQRGPFSINKPGDSSCYNRTPQCGKHKPEVPKAQYYAGENSQIYFQQNLNHWTKARPGYVDFAISYKVVDPQESDFIVLANLTDYAAHEMVVRTNYTFEVTWPTKPCAHCVVRARYVSHNPDERSKDNGPYYNDAIFYNCADITLLHTRTHPPIPPAADAVVRREKACVNSISSLSDLSPTEQELGFASMSTDEPIEKEMLARRHALHVPQYGCCAPSSGFTINYETKYKGLVTWNSRIVRSDDLKFARYDHVPTTDPSAGFYTIADYNKMIEYFVDRKTGKCALYGPDALYPWCFGTKAAPNTMILESVWKLNSTLDMVWWQQFYQQNRVSRSWIAATTGANSSTCFPAFERLDQQVVRSPTNQILLYSYDLEHMSMSVDKKLFEKPASCPNPP